MAEVDWRALAGNPTLLVLALMSCSACGLGVHKALSLRAFGRRQSHALATLLAHLGEGTPQSARALNASLDPHAASKLFAELLARPEDGLSRAIRREHARVARYVRARLWVLGSIAATAPFIGLFGTVLGIMRAFAAMAAEGAGGLQVVSGGISEALTTTAAGIFVAIEAVCLFNWLEVVSQAMVASNREAIEVLAERLAGAHVER